MEQNQNEYTPTLGGPAPTLQDAGGSVGILGMMHMHWRILNEPDGPCMQLATPFPLGVPHAAHPATSEAPEAAGEAGERWEVLTQEQRAAIQQAAEAWRPFQHGKPPEVTVGEYIRAQIDYERAVGPDVVLGSLAYVAHLEARLHAAEAATVAAEAQPAGLGEAWVSVGERLPEVECRILAVYAPGAYSNTTSEPVLATYLPEDEWGRENRFVVGGGYNTADKFSHLMPLPDGPLD